MTFVTPVEHWLEREIAQWVHHEGSIQRPIANMVTTELHVTLRCNKGCITKDSLLLYSMLVSK